MIRIAKLRKEIGYSQTQLADYLGVSQQAISKYENEDREPDIDTIIKLCHLFNVSSDYLLGKDDASILDESDELTVWVGELLRPANNGTFKQRFAHMLSKLDEKDWITLEKMVLLMNEEKAGQDA